MKRFSLNIFKLNRRLGERGISLVETVLATAVSGAVIYGGVTVLSMSKGMERNSNGQSIVDRELAAGMQLANNPERILPYVNASSLGDCLTHDQNTDCTRFSSAGFHPYPNDTGAKGPTFNTLLSEEGSCAGKKPELCTVKRDMEYRWICTTRECSGIENRVRVTPMNSLAGKVKPRESGIKLDRRQLMTRAQILFQCDKGADRRAISGLNYGQLSDVCATVPESRCELPTVGFQAPSGNDCRAPLNSDCGNGFSSAGLDDTSASCVGASPGRTVASVDDGTINDPRTNRPRPNGDDNPSDDDNGGNPGDGGGNPGDGGGNPGDGGGNPGGDGGGGNPNPQPQRSGVWTYYGINGNTQGICPGGTMMGTMFRGDTMGPCNTIGATCSVNVMGNALAGGGGHVRNYICQ